MDEQKKKNKVTFGLKNVFIWPIASTDADGVPTYEEGFKLPGAKEITFSAEGSSDPFYADDLIYFQANANSGYSGTLTIADINEEFRTKILAETKDTNGAIIENSDAVTKEFAMAFEFKGDVKERRHLFYRCKATRPSVSSKTSEDKIDPNTPEISITAAPRLDTRDVKASCEKGDACYDTWFGKAPYNGTIPTT